MNEKRVFDFSKDFAEVDGVQVVSSRWIFEQMQAMGCQIDRANTMAAAALALVVFRFLIDVIRMFI